MELFIENLQNNINHKLLSELRKGFKNQSKKRKINRTKNLKKGRKVSKKGRKGNRRKSKGKKKKN